MVFAIAMACVEAVSVFYTRALVDRIEPYQASEACWGPIMECQDATAHVADYLAGSLPLEELEGLLTACGGCAACSDKLTAAEETRQELGPIPPVAPDPPAMRRRFNAVLAGYQWALGGRPRNIRPPRCTTCSFPGQSCSWICRVRFC